MPELSAFIAFSPPEKRRIFDFQLSALSFQLSTLNFQCFQLPLLLAPIASSAFMLHPPTFSPSQLLCLCLISFQNKIRKNHWVGCDQCEYNIPNHGKKTKYFLQAGYHRFQGRCGLKTMDDPCARSCNAGRKQRQV